MEVAGTAEVSHYVGLARMLVDRWAEEAVRREDGFRIVLLPRLREGRLGELFSPHRVPNLYEEIGAYEFADTPWRFENNGHWNELGNLLAAVHLYRALAPELPGQRLTEYEIRRAVHAYYQAFGGWQPSLWSEPWEVPAEQLEAIRKRYRALE